MLAEYKPSNALIGSESFIRLPSARRAFFCPPRLGMTRRVSRAIATPTAFFWPVRFQIRYGRPLRRSRAKSPPRSECVANAVRALLPETFPLIFSSKVLKNDLRGVVRMQQKPQSAAPTAAKVMVFFLVSPPLFQFFKKAPGGAPTRLPSTFGALWCHAVPQGTNCGTKRAHGDACRHCKLGFEQSRACGRA